MSNLEKSLSNEQMNNAFDEISSNSAINIMVQGQVYKYGNGYCIESGETRYIYDSEGKFDGAE